MQPERIGPACEAGPEECSGNCESFVTLDAAARKLVIVEYMRRDPSAEGGVSHRTIMIPPGFAIHPRLERYYYDIIKTSIAFKELRKRHDTNGPILFVLAEGNDPIGGGILDGDISVRDIAYVACILCEAEHGAALAFVAPDGITAEDEAACVEAGGKVCGLVKKAAAS